MLIRSAITNWLNPVVWRLPGKAAAKFYHFSLTEYSSVLDLTLAANLTPSSERAAQYVRHLQDEMKHTQIFYRRANKLRAQAGKPPYSEPDSDYENLFEALGEKRFLAFVHLGEKRGCMQFTSYRDYFARIGDDYTSSIFATVLKDEQQHMDYTWELLVAMCGGVQAARAEVTKAKWWEARRSWMRAGRALTGKLFVVVSLAAYGFLLPYKLLTLGQAHRADAGWKDA